MNDALSIKTTHAHAHTHIIIITPSDDTMTDEYEMERILK
jgi:hypothetical protein